MEQGAMRNVVVSFFAGFVIAQAVWWFVAGGGMRAASPSGALGFLLLDVVEILAASACFALALALAGRTRRLRREPAGALLSLAAGAATATIAAPPAALVPRVLPGDGQFLFDILAAVVVSAIFGWLVSSLFSTRIPAEEAS
jgi:hypothetical protein